jgi:hypothetical protein
MCNSLTSVTIGNGVTLMREMAFSNCERLASVTIGNSVTGIGQGTFQRCASLTGVTIPASVTSIGPNAFYNCDSLTSVTFQGSIAAENFSTFNSFPAAPGAVTLRNLYVAEGPGTYTRAIIRSAWMRQE